MDGLFFYWILWMAWVIFMFFVPNTYQHRYAILFHLLAVIFLAAYELKVYRYVMNLSSIYLFIVCSFYIRSLSLFKTIAFILSCFIISLGYASFQIFSLVDPIWVIFKAEWMLGILLNYLVIILFRDWKMRIVALLIGMIIGDSIYAALLRFNYIPYTAGSYVWMDMAVLILLLNFIWVSLEFTSRFIQGAIANQNTAKGTSRLR